MCVWYRTAHFELGKYDRERAQTLGALCWMVKGTIQLIDRWFFSLGRGRRRVLVVVVGVVEDTGNAPATASSAPLLYLSLLCLHSFPPSPWRPVASVTALPPAALPVRVTLGFLRGSTGGRIIKTNVVAPPHLLCLLTGTTLKKLKGKTRGAGALAT